MMVIFIIGTVLFRMLSTETLAFMRSVVCKGEGLKPATLPLSMTRSSPELAPVRASKGFNVLEKNPFGQQALVRLARWGWRFIFNRLLVELAPQDKEGSYTRTGYNIKNGELGDDAHPLVAGRYHLYVGNPCPWCHQIGRAHV